MRQRCCGLVYLRPAAAHLLRSDDQMLPASCLSYLCSNTSRAALVLSGVLLLLLLLLLMLPLLLLSMVLTVVVMMILPVLVEPMLSIIDELGIHHPVLPAVVFAGH